MSIDRSLKTSGNLAKHRNVLTRTERIAKLTSLERFNPESDYPTGLPKVTNKKSTAGKKPKKQPGAEEAETATGNAAAESSE